MSNCNLVQDLLPLYVEALLSEDSKTLVEAHLATCPGCQAKLAELKQDFQPENLEQEPLKFLRKSLKKEKRSYGLAIFLAIISALIILLSFLTQPAHFEDDGQLFKLTRAEKQVFVEFKNAVAQVDIWDDGEVIFLEAHTSPLAKLLKDDRNIILAFDKSETVYYSNHQQDASHVAGPPLAGGVQLLPRLALNFYFVLALILLIVGFLIFLARKYVLKKDTSWKVSVGFLALPLSFILSFLTIKGFSGVSHYLLRDFIFICLTGLSYYLLILSLFALKNSRL